MTLIKMIWSNQGNEFAIKSLEIVERSRTFDELPAELVNIGHGHTSDKLLFFLVLG